LSVDDRIRDFATSYSYLQPAISPLEWRRLYIRAISLIFKAAAATGFKLIPGQALPENITVDSVSPMFISLENIRFCQNKLGLVKSVIDNFYLKVAAAYPWAEKILDLTWIFDACFEIHGTKKQANDFLSQLQEELETEDLELDWFGSLKHQLEVYLNEIRKNPVLPISVLQAIRQYKEWELTRTEANEEEKERKILDLIEEFHLYQRPEWIRFYFYRHTYFSSASADVAGF